MRVLPNMHILVPADANQTRASVLASLEVEGPVYIRFGRNAVPQIYDIEKKVEIGKGNLLKDGGDVTLIACGALVNPALRAAEILEKSGVATGVIDMVSIKPLDIELLLDQVERTGAVVVAENHQVTGGLFGAVAETLALNLPVKMDVVAVHNSFGTSGSPEEVMEKYGLTASLIAEKALRLLH